MVGLKHAMWIDPRIGEETVAAFQLRIVADARGQPRSGARGQLAPERDQASAQSRIAETGSLQLGFDTRNVDPSARSYRLGHARGYRQSRGNSAKNVPIRGALFQRCNLIASLEASDREARARAQLSGVNPDANKEPYRGQQRGHKDR
jgi:hypothetical protein